MNSKRRNLVDEVDDVRQAWIASGRRLQFSIGNGPVDIVSFPMNSIVMFHIFVGLPVGNIEIQNQTVPVPLNSSSFNHDWAGKCWKYSC